MKIAVISNPISGGGRGLKTEKAFHNFLLTRNIDFKIYRTERRKHAIHIAAELGEEFQRIVIIGGDGTINEVVSGLQLEHERALGVIPIGSGNDFALNLKLPKSLSKVFDIVLGEEPKTISPDLWSIEVIDSENQKINRIMLNSCGIGFDAKVAFLNQNKKIISGIFSYIITIFQALRDYEFVNIDFKTENIRFTGEKLFLSIGNGKTAGGGLYLTPDAINDDNFLNFTIIDPINKFRLIKELPKAVINRLKSVQAAQFGVFSSAQIILEKPYYIHVDGEILSSKSKKININRLQEKINFISNV